MNYYSIADDPMTEFNINHTDHETGDVEYNAVRNATGICDQSHRGKIRMTGADRQHFLHRVVTNDVQQLSVGEGVYACMLTPQGKIISDMTIYVREEDVLIDVEPEMATLLLETLEHYALIDDVKFDNITEQYGLIGVYGRKATISIRSLVGHTGELLPNEHIEVAWNGLPLTIVRSHRTGETDYDIYVPASSVIEVWKALGNKKGDAFCVPIGSETLEGLRVEAGIPRCTSELDERTIPNESVKDRAVSFTKGCYIGQEPVVMMEHRGRPNRLLTGLIISGTSLPERNAVIQKDGQDAGWITTAVHGRAIQGIIAFGFVRRRFKQLGELVGVTVDGRLVDAKVVDLPFNKTEQ